MDTYKSGQGSFTRLTAALGLGVAVFLGCANVYYWIRSPRTDEPIFGLGSDLLRNVPGVGGPLSWKLLLCVALFVGSIFLLKRLMTRASTVDLLVETEMEMRKVSWPTQQESLNATGVVILVSIVLTGSLTAFDFVLRTMFSFVF